MTLPEPDCDRGYSFDFLGDLLSEERFDELIDWLNGQTMALCEGRHWDPETDEYYESQAHGPVVYTWDVERFMRGGPILD